MPLIITNYGFEIRLHQARGNALEALNARKQQESTTYGQFFIYPSDYVCAYFSHVVYEKDFGMHQLLQGWQLLRVGSDKESGYDAAVYWHAENRHLVIAHRGTERSQSNDISMDMMSIVRGHPGSQMVAAKEFVLTTLKEFEGAHISVTSVGHSLGGWLSQIALFHIYEAIKKQELKTVHAKTVAFESPGAARMLENISPNLQPLVNLDELNITNYVSAPNMINTANRHLGTVYQCRFDFKPAKSYSVKDAILSPTTLGLKDLIRYTEETHDMTELLAQFNAQTGRAKRVKKMHSWPVTVWQDGSKRSLTAIGILGLLKDYVFKTDNRELKSFDTLADRIQTTNIHVGVLDLEQAYQLEYDANYLPAKENVYVIKTSMFQNETITFLNYYNNVIQVAGKAGIDLLHMNFSKKGQTQLPMLLEQLQFENIPQSTVKILKAKNQENLAHYLLHVELLCPNFFKESFDLFDGLLQKAAQSSSTASTHHILYADPSVRAAMTRGKVDITMPIAALNNPTMQKFLQDGHPGNKETTFETHLKTSDPDYVTPINDGEFKLTITESQHTTDTNNTLKKKN
ncbi:MAG: DUF6792 domain-containing protein [Legionellales bacterium]|jgi:hypothetical protein